MDTCYRSKWQGKNVLAIGDSITADGRWQKEFARITGCNIKTHAYGGVGLIDMIEGLGASQTRDIKYDPYTGANGNFGPLTQGLVKWADLIIILGAYNERDIEYGERGDVYPEKETLRGKYSYVIEKIYKMMGETDNMGCHIMIVTPHCTGKYDWIDRDGYEDFPRGSGRSLETMSEEIKKIAAEYNLPCCDAWKNSGINRFTWNYYANSPCAIREDYDPEKTYEAPYPMYADQAHLNALGYAKLGECIAGFAELA